MTGSYEGKLLGVIEGCTNPESAEMLDDGERFVFGNCALNVGYSWFREGQGLVYTRGKAFISRVRVSADGVVTLEERHLIDGLTTTLGCDVLRTGTEAFPAGTVLMAAGGKPVTDDGCGPVETQPHVLAFDPSSGEILGRIPLWDGSPIADRFNGLETPNGLAVSTDGFLYVTDYPHTNPSTDPAAPPPAPPAGYVIPFAAFGPLMRGESTGADSVRASAPGARHSRPERAGHGQRVSARRSRPLDVGAARWWRSMRTPPGCSHTGPGRAPSSAVGDAGGVVTMQTPTVQPVRASRVELRSRH